MRKGIIVMYLSIVVASYEICSDESLKCQDYVPLQTQQASYTVDSSKGFHNPNCSDHGSGIPYRTNSINAATQQTKLLYAGFPRRPIDVRTFDALTNPDYPLMATSRMIQDRTFSASELVEFEKSFQPSELDFGLKPQFQMLSQKFHFQNIQRQFHIKVNEIKTDNPYVSIHTKDAEKVQVIKSDRRVAYEARFLPVEIGEMTANIYFLVEIHSSKNEVQNHYKSRKQAQRTFVLKLKVTVQENDNKIKPIIFEQGQKVHLMSLFNPLKAILSIEEVTSVNKEVWLRIPRSFDYEDEHARLDEKFDPTEMKYTITSQEPVLKERGYWDVQTKGTKKFAQVLLKPNVTGIIQDTIRIKFSKGIEYEIPVVARVLENGLNFLDHYVDMGVLTSPNVSDHEYVVNVLNTASSQVEVLEMSFTITPPFHCFKVQALPQQTTSKGLTSKRLYLMTPYEQRSEILKINIYSGTEMKSGSYKAQLSLVSRNLLTGLNNTIHLNFWFAEFISPLVFSPVDLSLYINIAEYEQFGQMKTDLAQRLSRDINKQNAEVLLVERDVSLKNNFTSSLILTRVHTLNPELQVLGIRNRDLRLNQSKVMVFNVQFTKEISTLPMFFMQTHLVLEFNHQFTVPVPFIIFDKRLDCGVTSTQMSRCQLSGPHKSINFRNVGVNEFRVNHLYFTNNNPIGVDVSISLDSSPPPSHNSALNTLRISFDEIFGAKGSLDKNKSIKEQNSTKRRQVFRLEYKQTAVLGFFLEARQIEQGQRWLVINTTYESIEIPVTYTVLGGQVNMLPQSLHFDQCFPGRRASQRISLKSSYNTPFEVLKVVSNDRRFVVRLLNNTITPGIKTEIAEVLFDANLDNQVYVLDDQSKLNFYQNFISYHDLQLWRKNMLAWNQMVDRSLTDVKANITVQTEVQQTVQTSARVILIFPQLLRENVIDLSLHDSHRHRSIKQITLHNPSDNPVRVQLFLGPGNLSSSSYQDSLLAEFKAQETGNLLICASEQQKPKLWQFIEELQFLYINPYEFRHFSVKTSVGQVDYDYEMVIINQNGKRENKTFDHMRSILNQETMMLLDNQKQIQCLDGTVPARVKEFFDYYRVQRTLWDIASDNASNLLMEDWMKAFTKLYQDFIEVKQISYYTTSQHGSLRDLIYTPTIEDKLWHFVRRIGTLFDSLYSRQPSKMLFQLTDAVKGHQFVIDAHSNLTLDALIHRPGGTQNATLLIKNNITVLQIVPIVSQDGMSQLVLTNSLINQNEKVPIVSALQEEYSFRIEDREIKNQPNANLKVMLQRVLYIYNTGNTSVSFNKPKLDGEDCQAKVGVWVSECRPITLAAKDVYKMHIHIDDYLATIGQMDTLDLSLLSSTYYVNFKLRFVIPPKYHSHILDLQDPTESFGSLVLLIASLAYLFWSLHDAFRPQLPQGNQILIKLTHEFKIQENNLLQQHELLRAQQIDLILRKEQEKLIEVRPPLKKAEPIKPAEEDRQDAILIEIPVQVEAPEQEQPEEEKQVSVVKVKKAKVRHPKKVHSKRTPNEDTLAEPAEPVEPTQPAEPPQSVLPAESEAVTTDEQVAETSEAQAAKPSTTDTPVRLTKKQLSRINKMKRIQANYREKEDKVESHGGTPEKSISEEIKADPLRQRHFEHYEPNFDLQLAQQVSHPETEQISFSESEIKSLREEGDPHLKSDQDSVIKDNFGDFLYEEQEKMKFLKYYAKDEEEDLGVAQSKEAEDSKFKENSSDSFSSGEDIDEDEKDELLNSQTHSSGEFKTPTPQSEEHQPHQFNLFEKIAAPPKSVPRIFPTSYQLQQQPQEQNIRDAWKNDNIFFNNEEEESNENESESQNTHPFDEKDMMFEQNLLNDNVITNTSANDPHPHSLPSYPTTYAHFNQQNQYVNPMLSYQQQQQLAALQYSMQNQSHSQQYNSQQMLLNLMLQQLKTQVQQQQDNPNLSIQQQIQQKLLQQQYLQFCQLYQPNQVYDQSQQNNHYNPLGLTYPFVSKPISNTFYVSSSNLSTIRRSHSTRIGAIHPI